MGRGRHQAAGASQTSGEGKPALAPRKSQAQAERGFLQGEKVFANRSFLRWRRKEGFFVPILCLFKAIVVPGKTSKAHFFAGLRMSWLRKSKYLVLRHFPELSGFHPSR